MCGIFGLIVNNRARFNQKDIESAIETLFWLSESRGREAAGLAVRFHNQILVFKESASASEMLRSKDYRQFWNDLWSLTAASSRSKPLESNIAFIGHSRLVTNGLQGLAKNNQPVIKSGIVGVHNGIVVNDDALWRKFPDLVREAEVDTEVFLALLRREIDKGSTLPLASRQVFSEIQGAASVAALFEELPVMLLATNTGSMYLCRSNDGNTSIFTSERYIIEQVLNNRKVRAVVGPATFAQVKPQRGVIIDLGSNEHSEFSLNGKAQTDTGPVNISHGVRFRIKDVREENDCAIERLRRCTRCILPETMPFITFDDRGVCSFCNNHKVVPAKGHAALAELLKPFRSKNGEPDCIVAFSGGRDSSYSLHYISHVLGMKPLAYTYDWGMVTDLARRNQARICGKLGIEHILISADIRKKRDNIRRNIQAWLKRPQLGMIPLFMAGDKQYFYYAHKLKQQTGIGPVFFAPNQYERTGFKTGFCGLDFANKFFFGFSLLPKLKLASYYLKQYMLNPFYFNRSLGDTMFSFYSSFFLPHDYHFFYDFIPWNETEMMSLLRNEYDWEAAKDTGTTWRIGDGTAAFYNYIYYTVAGFSEHDTFLSNQIRDGVISRDAALAIARENNKPRFESIREYAHQTGFDCDYALHVINSMPKLYRKGISQSLPFQSPPLDAGISLSRV